MADYSRYDRLEKEMIFREKKMRKDLTPEKESLPLFMSKEQMQFKPQEEAILLAVREAKLSQWDAMLELTKLMEQYYGKEYLS